MCTPPIINTYDSTESRRPPGVIYLQNCLVWVELVASFIRAAMRYGHADNLSEDKYTRDTDGLKQFIKEAYDKDMNDKDALKVAFQDCSGYEPPTPVPEMTEEMREKLRKKNNEERMKNIIMDKMLAREEGDWAD